jgi:hypothetical protein
MLRVEQRRLTRKHSQKVQYCDLAFQCDSNRHNSTPELKKLTSRDTTETEDEHEDKE